MKYKSLYKLLAAYDSKRKVCFKTNINIRIPYSGWLKRASLCKTWWEFSPAWFENDPKSGAINF